jgi:hypothetical protein
VHDIAEGIADQNDIAIAIDQRRGVGVIGGSITIGSPFLRARISGAVLRLMVDCTDI